MIRDDLSRDDNLLEKIMKIKYLLDKLPFYKLELHLIYYIDVQII